MSGVVSLEKRANVRILIGRWLFTISALIGGGGFEQAFALRKDVWSRSLN